MGDGDKEGKALVESERVRIVGKPPLILIHLVNIYTKHSRLTVLWLYDREILGEQCTVKNYNLVDFVINIHEIYCL